MNINHKYHKQEQFVEKQFHTILNWFSLFFDLSATFSTILYVFNQLQTTKDYRIVYLEEWRQKS